MYTQPVGEAAPISDISIYVVFTEYLLCSSFTASVQDLQDGLVDMCIGQFLILDAHKLLTCPNVLFSFVLSTIPRTILGDRRTTYDECIHSSTRV